jgi:putative serine protease PepD
VAATFVVGALAGGGSGYLAGALADRGSTVTSTVASSATPVSLSTSSTFSAATAAAAVADSVVTVHATVTTRSGRYTQTGEATGTGIIYSSDGLIITNNHVVEGATSVGVTLPGSSQDVVATVVATDPTNDVAVLRVEGVTGLTPATFADSELLVVGQSVIAMGNALALEGSPSVTAGIVSAVGRSIDLSEGTLSGLIQTDAGISSGDSGGPLVDGNGHVVGMNTAGASGDSSTTVENLGFAIPSNHLLEVVKQLLGSTT